MTKMQILAEIQRTAEAKGGSGDVLRWCEEYVSREKQPSDSRELDEEETVGFVYLLRSARYYKIGRSNSSGRREYELAIQLPEPVRLVHEIRTDDPVGIE